MPPIPPWAIRAILVVVAVIAIVVVTLVVADQFSGRSAKNLAVKEETKAGVATVAAAQSNAAQAAQQIIVSGGARDRVDLEVHQANDQAIAAAPGASAALDPRLNAVGIAGLCRHKAYRDDARCAQAER